MKWWIILLVLIHCSCELVIKLDKSLTGFEGKSISSKMEMKVDGGEVHSVEVYGDNGKTLIINSAGVVTANGTRLFGNRISRRFWKAKRVYYYELIMKNLLCSDARNFLIKVFYEDKNEHQKTDNTSRINLEVKVIPNRVEVVRYELNAINCTTVELEQVNNGTYYPDVKYLLTFVTNNGSIYERETNMANQTTFVDCQDKNLQNARSVNVRAVHKDFTWKPSRNVNRTDIMDSATTTPTVTNSGTPKSKGYLLIIFFVPIALVLLIVFCFCMFKSNPLFSNGKNLDEEKNVLQMENAETTGKSNTPSMDEDYSPFIEDSSFVEDSPFVDMQQPTYAESEPTVISIQPVTPPATPLPATQPAYVLDENFYGNKQLYALVSKSGKDLNVELENVHK